MRIKGRVITIFFFFSIIIITVLVWGFMMSTLPPIIIGLTQLKNIDGGANGADEAIGMVTDENDFLYVTGFITIPGQSKDIWLAKFDPDLNILINTTINGAVSGDDVGHALVLGENDSLYLLGYISQPNVGHDIFLAKINCTDLSIVKNFTLNGLDNSTDEGYGMIFNELDNNLYVVGTVQEPNEGYNIYIGKFDTNLNLIKNITLNGPANGSDKGRSLAFDDSSNLYVTGSKTQEGTGCDLWLGKFNTNLTLLNEIIVASPTTGEDKGYDLLCDEDDTIYITGTLFHNTQGNNIFLAKYNTSLNQLQNVTINGPANGEDIGYSLIFDGHGELSLTGVYSENDGGANAWVALFRTNLNLIQQDTLDGPAHGYDTGYGIISTIDHGTIVSGFINTTTENTNIWIGQISMAYI